MSSARRVMKPQRLVCLGGIPLDIVVTTSVLPIPGGDVRTTPVVDRPGGPFSVLSAAARLGMRTLYAGAYGSGARGATVRQALDAEGVEVVREPRTESDTGFSLVMVEPSGERTCVSAPGAEALLTADDLAVYDPQPGDVVHVTGYDLADPAGYQFVKLLEGLGPEIGVFFDPGPLAALVPPGFSYNSLRRVLKRADFVSMNRAEAEAVIGDPELSTIERELSPATIIIRDGAAGAWLLQEGYPPFHADAPQVELVDATGAGDTHAGAFLAALASGLEPRAALNLATIAASLSVRESGPGTGPTRAQVAEVLTRGA